MLQFLAHLEDARGCSPQTRNQRLTAICSFARFVGSRSPEHVEWCTQIRALPRKKAAPKPISYLEKSEIDRCRRFACTLAGANARLAEKRGLAAPSFQGTFTLCHMPVSLALVPQATPEGLEGPQRAAVRPTWTVNGLLRTATSPANDGSGGAMRPSRRREGLSAAAAARTKSQETFNSPVFLFDLLP